PLVTQPAVPVLLRQVELVGGGDETTVGIEHSRQIVPRVETLPLVAPVPRNRQQTVVPAATRRQPAGHPTDVPRGVGVDLVLGGGAPIPHRSEERRVGKESKGEETQRDMTC